MACVASILQDLSMLKAVIFDLDGLLIDSEPLWRKAEIEILTPLGVPLSEEMCRVTQGTRVDRAIAHWYESFPWKSPKPEAIEQQVVDRVIELIRDQGQPMAGAIEIIDFFKAKNLPIGLCSSSWMNVIAAAIERLGIEDRLDVIYSAENETYGKPHPGCYITAAQKLGVEPYDCIVFEDSFNGAIAAKAALMNVVAIPEPFLADSGKWGFCDLVLDSLRDFSSEHFASLELANRKN